MFSKPMPPIMKYRSSRHEAENILAAVVTKANDRGIKIRSMDIREPNLEAVFLHLTGRALRD
jgi:ABC-2 type transport system ATP-binding protein